MNYQVVSFALFTILGLIWSRENMVNLFFKTIFVAMSIWSAVLLFGVK